MSKTKSKVPKKTDQVKLIPSKKNAIPKENKENTSRGRPQEHVESWSKITVTLLDKQIHWLDHLASTIRLNTKSAISRTELIRALIAAVEGSEIDLSQLKSEAEIKDHILKAYNNK